MNRHQGVRVVYDLSATPFFLSGSNGPEGTLFPWVMTDFSLMDAIECGIVKLPRVPIADNDAIWLNGGNDIALGGSGSDRLYGGTGMDELSGGSGHDRLYGASGEDVLRGGADSDRLYGGSERDSLSGGSGNDLLSGGTGHDILWGEAGRDTLYGGAGNDFLRGGSGLDILYGGSGADTFHFLPGEPSTSSGTRSAAPRRCANEAATHSLPPLPPAAIGRSDVPQSGRGGGTAGSPG